MHTAELPELLDSPADLPANSAHVKITRAAFRLGSVDGRLAYWCVPVCECTCVCVCVCVCEGERSFIHYKCPSCCVKLKLWRSRAILRALSSPAERAAKPDDCIALDFISSPVATHTHTHTHTHTLFY